MEATFAAKPGLLNRADAGGEAKGLSKKGTDHPGWPFTWRFCVIKNQNIFGHFLRKVGEFVFV